METFKISKDIRHDSSINMFFGNYKEELWLFESKQSWFGRIITPYMNTKKPIDLKSSEINPNIIWNWNITNNKKIPFQLLEQIISFFKDIYEKQQTEAQAEIWYNKINKKYFIYIHNQKASFSSVERDNSIENPFNIKDNINIMNLHSHHTMGAFWSSIDDENDKGGTLYGVIAWKDENKPEMLFRTIHNEIKFELNIEDLFEKSTHSQFIRYKKKEKWIEKVKKNEFIFEYDTEFSNYGQNWINYEFEKPYFVNTYQQNSKFNNIYEFDYENYEKKRIIKKFKDIFNKLTLKEKEKIIDELLNFYDTVGEKNNEFK